MGQEGSGVVGWVGAGVWRVLFFKWVRKGLFFLAGGGLCVGGFGLIVLIIRGHWWLHER